jgi:hypothetical protein
MPYHKVEAVVNGRSKFVPDEPVLDLPDDVLTPLATTILTQSGESAYGKLTVNGAAPALAGRLLKSITPEQLFARPIKNPDDAKAALAGLWLWFDALDECHAIAQDIISPTGSFWHAIMHRREGDFSNAKYWYRRCESHYVNKMMGAIASSIAGELASDRAVAHAVGDGWNPIGFVDLVQAVHHKPADPRFALAVRLQRAEWHAMFTHCVRTAVDADASDLDGWDRRVTNPSGG